MSSVDPPDSSPAGKRARVLVVDDDIVVRRSVGRLLRGSFDVELAGSVAEAITRLGAPPPIDVVLTDLRMPGQDGLDLWRWLSASHPRLARRLVVMSGDVAALPEVARETGAAILKKPFDLATLVETVRDRTSVE